MVCLINASLSGTNAPGVTGVQAFCSRKRVATVDNGLFGAAAGTIVGQTIEAEAVNVKKQMEEMKTYREYMAFKKGPIGAEATS